MGENYAQKLKKFRSQEMPLKISADDFKEEDKRLFREVMLGDIKKTVAEAFCVSKSVDEVGKHV